MRSVMAALAAQPTRSRRFIKVYLIVWALIATGALSYLTLLAFPSSSARQAAQPAVASETAEPGPTLRALAKSFAEMGVAVRRGFGDVQKDITHLKEVAVEQDGKSKAAETRLTALEERVAAVESAQTEARPAPKGKQPEAKPAPKAAPPPAAKTSDASPRAPNVINVQPPVAATRVNEPAPIETGSIPAAKEVASKEIVFGAPVVTPSTIYAVQLGASPSMDGLRQRWDELVDRHGALVTLQPRVVETRGGGPYKLVAGPLQSKADADRLCADMRAARTTCFTTPYAGSPL
jgi:hypothetical protein